MKMLRLFLAQFFVTPVAWSQNTVDNSIPEVVSNVVHNEMGKLVLKAFNVDTFGQICGDVKLR